MRGMLIFLAMSAGAFPGAVAAEKSAPPVKVLYSFEREALEKEMGKSVVRRLVEQEDGSLLYRHDVTLCFVKKHATRGEWSVAYRVSRGRYNLLPRYARGVFPSLTARPPVDSYHDPADWFYQRFCQIIDDALGKRYRAVPQDWSAYSAFRFDVLSDTAPAILALRVHDMGGPRIRARPLGLRTGLATFRVPAGRQVTCEFPLAEMLRVAEMDPTRIWGFNLRVNGYRGETTVYIDNIRLVSASAAEADARLPIVRMEGKPRPFARKVTHAPPVETDPRGLERRTGKVEPVGPVTVLVAPGGYACGFGHFGGSGATYFQNTIRGVVAYDSERILVALDADLPKGKVRRATKHVCEGGGVVALASFDGGKTWGGLAPGEKLPVLFGNWYWRAFASADRFGNLYHIGTENCCSYHEGYDVYLRRLTFAGRGWVEDRLSIIDQNLQKCPSVSRALRLRSGRIWAVWTDGWGGCVAKYSDDDGFTWAPCKDASLAPPRPLYAPGLAVLKDVASYRPPRDVLLWPGTPVVGPLLVPYRDQVAVFSADGSAWQVPDGRSWLPRRKGPFGRAKGPGHVVASVTALDDGRVFVARSAGYDNSARNEYTAPLTAAWLEGNNWHTETLEPAGVTDCILTASGEAVFCFYVKKVAGGLGGGEGEQAARYEVRYRRWSAGRWDPSVLVATETERINRLAAPQVSPPNCTCVLWDQWVKKFVRTPSWVRFARIPNR